jgi:hypothetical protein
MSTSPEDQLVNLLSQWLARHLGDADLRRALAAADVSTLGGGSWAAVAELRAELAPARGDDRHTRVSTHHAHPPEGVRPGSPGGNATGAFVTCLSPGVPEA